MTYIGQQPATTFDSGIQDRFTGLTTNTVTLTHEIAAEEDILVVWNNIVQDKNTYSVGGTGNKTLTLGGTLVSADVVTVYYLNKVMQSVNPTAGSVNTTQLADLGVTGAKLNTDVISAQTALGATPADTDELLVSDAGVLKRVDYSYLKSGGLVLLESIDASNTATVEFTSFPSTYYNYMIYFSNVDFQNNDEYMAIRAQVGGASGVRDGGNDYGNSRYGTRTNGDGAFTDLQTGDANYSMINFNNGIAVMSGDWEIHGYVHIWNPNSSHYKMISHRTVYGVSGNNMSEVQGSGVVYQNGALTKLQFMTENGENYSGNFRLYGIKK